MAPPSSSTVASRSLGLIHAASFGVSYLAAGWIVPLFERHGTDRGTAAAVGALVLLGGIVTRIGGGLPDDPQARAGRGRRSRRRSSEEAVAALLLALPLPLGVHALATLLAGLSAGLPFAIVFGAAQSLRPDAPAAAVAFVNSFAILLLLVGTPLAGAAFSLPGDGRIAFAAIGVACLLTLPAVRRAYLPEIGTKSRTLLAGVDLPRPRDLLLGVGEHLVPLRDPAREAARARTGR